MIYEDVNLPSIRLGTYRITIISNATELYCTGLVVISELEDFDCEVQRAVDQWRMDSAHLDRVEGPSILIEKAL